MGLMTDRKTPWWMVISVGGFEWEYFIELEVGTRSKYTFPKIYPLGFTNIAGWNIPH